MALLEKGRLWFLNIKGHEQEVFNGEAILDIIIIWYGAHVFVEGLCNRFELLMAFEEVDDFDHDQSRDLTENDDCNEQGVPLVAKLLVIFHLTFLEQLLLL